MSKFPVIGQINTFGDVRSALNNIREWGVGIDAASQSAIAGGPTQKVSSLYVSDLTPGRIVYAGDSGQLKSYQGLVYNETTGILSLPGLASQSVIYIGDNGALSISSNFHYDYTNNRLKVNAIGVRAGATSYYSYFQGQSQSVDIAYVLPASYPAGVNAFLLKDNGTNLYWQAFPTPAIGYASFLFNDGYGAFSWKQFPAAAATSSFLYNDGSGNISWLGVPSPVTGTHAMLSTNGAGAITWDTIGSYLPANTGSPSFLRNDGTGGLTWAYLPALPNPPGYDAGLRITSYGSLYWG